MRTTPVYPEGVKHALLVYNSAQYQVLSFMNGLACELLKKEPDVTGPARRGHNSYPSVFLQGDAATEFLDDLATAQAKLKRNPDVDSLFLSEYDHIMH